jgi:hypothetical protein
VVGEQPAVGRRGAHIRRVTQRLAQPSVHGAYPSRRKAGVTPSTVKSLLAISLGRVVPAARLA